MMKDLIESDKAREMSLDEIIQKSGMYVSPYLKQRKLNTHEEEDILINEIDDVLDIKADEFSYADFDKTLESNSFESKTSTANKSTNFESKNIPAPTSQQWRLMPLNSSIERRPAGMPPLVMHDAAGVYNVNKRRNHIFDNNFKAKDEHYHFKNRKNYQNRPYNNNNIRRKNHNNQRNNFVLQTNITPLMSLQQNRINNNAPEATNLTISVPATHLNNGPVSTVMAQKSFTNGIISNASNNNGIHSNDPTNGFGIISQSFQNINFQALAQQLVGVLQQAKETPKPKYDLKVQKEIHILQNKPLVYKCREDDAPSVLSFDGPGLETDLQPSATGISLNQRFS